MMTQEPIFRLFFGRINCLQFARRLSKLALDQSDRRNSLIYVQKCTDYFL
jgi:hypothetical protein